MGEYCSGGWCISFIWWWWSLISKYMYEARCFDASLILLKWIVGAHVSCCQLYFFFKTFAAKQEYFR